MKNITCLLLFTFSLCATAQNLVTNGSAENAPITNDWTVVSGNWTQRSSNPAPQDGTAYFFAGANSYAEIYQDIDVSGNSAVIDLGTQFYSFSCYLRSFNQAPADASKAIVTYRDNSGSVLHTYDTGFGTNQAQWDSYSDARLAPVGTRTVRITLISDRNSGTNNDGYIDNVVFEEGNTLSTPTVNYLEGVSVYPNPSKGTIQFTKSIDELVVFDSTGKVILTQKNIQKSQPITLNVSQGVYVFKISNSNNSIVIKHVVK